MAKNIWSLYWKTEVGVLKEFYLNVNDYFKECYEQVFECGNRGVLGVVY